jgi:protein-S-isoprenylcysteine O-methyltransferase Ste14
VTDGPYRYLRHPRYFGIIVFAKGIALVFRSEVGLILVVALFLVLLWRIRDEETLMREEFGPEWEAYAQKSWGLIPFVY